LAGVRTYARNLDWADDETLWKQAVEASPDSFKTHLGLAEIRAHNHPSDVSLDGAITELERAMSIVAGLPLDKGPNNVYAELGEMYRLKGEAVARKKADATPVPSEESRVWYQKAMQVLSRGAEIDRAVAAALRRQFLARGKKPEQITLFGLDRLYASLGLTNLRLDHPQQALEAFLYQRRLDPGNPAVYRHIAEAQLASGNLAAAAVALIEVHLLSDSDLDQAEIRDLYQRMGRSDCALTRGYIPTLNLDCSRVRSDICASLLDIAGALRELKLDAGVRQMKDLARDHYGCPMEAFDTLSRQAPSN
jgi:tetratricopeptide (TPR) repeat protein